VIVAFGAAAASLCLFLAVLGAGTSWVDTALAVDCNVSPGGSIQTKVSDPTCTAVIVAAGTYTENVVITRSIVLQGAGAASTIINGGGNGPVIRVRGGAAPTIQGFTITGGDATNDADDPGNGGGIHILNATAIIHDNVISGNVANTSNARPR
jgi:nitrous oxidase accessory protein NosD